MAIWFITINVSEVLLIKLSAQADGNSSVTWNKPLQCWEPAKRCAEEHTGSDRQISIADAVPHVSCSKTQRQLMRSTSLEDEVQDDFSEFVPKSLPLLCRLLYENEKAPATLRLPNPPGFGSFTENKQGRRNLPQAYGNAAGECLSPVACFSPLL